MLSQKRPRSKLAWGSSGSAIGALLAVELLLRVDLQRRDPGHGDRLHAQSLGTVRAARVPLERQLGPSVPTIRS